MHVRPIEQAGYRYLRNSMRAYLEGEQNLYWVTRITGDSPPAVARAIQAFNDIRTPTNPNRKAELMQWFQQRLEQSASEKINKES